MGNQQTCCFRKLLQRCHSTYCVQFWRIFNEGCNCFCCQWWYGQGVVSEGWLWFGGCFTWGRFNLHRHVVKCMRPFVVSRTTLLFLIKCNPIFGPVTFFITTKCSAKVLSPVSNFSVAVDSRFSNWPLATCIWKLGGSSILRRLFVAFCVIVSKSFWAIALIKALESTKASTVRLFSKSRGT